MPDPNPDPNNDLEYDDQSLAETFDEENITEDGRDIATSDLQRDVFDVTSVPEDAREALEPQDDWDPDAADEAELEEVVRADEDLDGPQPISRAAADVVADDGARPADFESRDLADDDLEALGYGEEAPADNDRRRLDEELDEGLKETFPASDPVAVSRGPG
jgi:hypothetical protein